MQNDFSAFYEQPHAPTDKMSKQELAEELTKFRNLMTWLDPAVLLWLARVGQTMRVVLRNYEAFTGKVGMTQFEPKTLTILTHTRDYDYSRGEATYEQKDVVVKIGELVDYQIIYEQEVVDEDVTPPKEEGEVDALEHALERKEG